MTPPDAVPPDDTPPGRTPPAPPAVTAASLARPGLRHGFFTRRGGVSTGLHESLNCGRSSHDRPKAVETNRARVAAALGVDRTRLVTLRQCHGARAVTLDTPLDTPWPAGVAPEADADADALATAQPGLALGILTADCAPILLADPAAGVIGAAHAGWRGALAGVVEAVIEAMAGLGARPARIRAAIGPCIGPASYEVGPEFEARFRRESPDSERFFAPGPGDRLLFDLPGYVAARLAGAGLDAPEIQAPDSFAEAGRFFSHRRNRLSGHADYGRQISAIALIA